MPGVFDRKNIDLYRVTFPSGVSKMKRLDKTKVDLYKNHNCKVAKVNKSPALARSENAGNGGGNGGNGGNEGATQGSGG